MILDLVKLLDSEEPCIRIHAAFVLSSFGPAAKKWQRKVMEVVQSTDECDHGPEIGEDATARREVIDALAPLLDDPESRMIGLWARRRFGSRDSFYDEWLRAWEDPDVGWDFFESLSSLEFLPEVDSPSVRKVLDALDLEISFRAQPVFRVLGAPPTEAVRDRLVEILQDPELDSDIRLEAACCLGKMPRFADRTAPLIAEFLVTTSNVSGEHLCLALDESGPAAKNVVPRLLRYEEDLWSGAPGLPTA